MSINLNASTQEISCYNYINEEGNKNNFYDICIQAIELNNDKIINKEECIKGINKLKLKSLNKKTPNNNGSPNKKKKDLKIPQDKGIRKKCIDEILKESRNKNQNFLNKLNLENKRNNSSENINSYSSNSNSISTNIDKNNKINKFFKGKQRRYTILKHINEYLESNNVTLNELIENNPFQDKPYNLSGSYEFIEAVKFENYDYVNEALLKNYNFLFVIDYYGQTGYHWAAKLGNIKMLNILINFGRHHNQKDFKGRTPLYLAAVNNNKEICKFLLDNGANPFLGDKKGKTPADVAGSTELSIFIKDNMAQPFSNPVYKAKMQRILKERANHIFKEGEDNDNQKFGGTKLSKVIEKLDAENNKKNTNE